jgi:hypothetical protein
MTKKVIPLRKTFLSRLLELFQRRQKKPIKPSARYDDYYYPKHHRNDDL